MVTFKSTVSNNHVSVRLASSRKSVAVACGDDNNERCTVISLEDAKALRKELKKIIKEIESNG